ncbi:GNAT family N-acetyltransferase [Lachnoclostridium sp. Marseille-P6806]|uniref:GNAT family N-acetyltransferase n=1 Tax=Lachnoclostridium sp. Marseille-P6806 TaxID=2364793 RepID=UPI00103078C9|nr:GNAT family N-acetyltransferase [Lachnoclostridium sp. Marseille-P6806]
MREPFVAEGPRIALRPMTLEDCGRVVRWRNNGRVRERYVYREAFTLEGQEEYFRTQIETGRKTQLMICEKDERGGERRAIGCMVFQDLNRELREIEYGLFIGEDDAAGKGFGTEAIRVGMRWAFGAFPVDRIICRIFTDNIPSLQSNERAGYRRTGLLEDVECSDGGRQDMYLLEIRPEDITPFPEGPAAASGGAARFLVSFVIPCYHCEATLSGVVAEIEATMQTLPRYAAEIIMVHDGCGGAAWDTIRALCRESDEAAAVGTALPGGGAPAVKRRGICLARNFGQHAALMAGIRAAAGDRIVCLDDDGQTPPDEAGKLLAAIEEGADVVYARYDHKQHGGFRNFGTRMNEEMTHRLLGKPKELYVSSYFAMRRYVALEMLRYENSYPYLIGLVLRTTTNIVNVPVHHRARVMGESGYTVTKLLSLWMNGFTAFSIKPLRFATAVGSVSAVLGILYGVYTVVKKIVNPGVPVGFSALMSAIVFFGGMTILMLGMAGEYIGRTYISVNRAPQYVIRETTEQEGVDDRTGHEERP